MKLCFRMKEGFHTFGYEEQGSEVLAITINKKRYQRKMADQHIEKNVDSRRQGLFSHYLYSSI